MGDYLQKLLLLIIEFGTSEQLRHAQYAIHGGSDLMAHHGQKLRLCLGGALGLLLRLKQFTLDLFAIANVAHHHGEVVLPTLGGLMQHD